MDSSFTTQSSKNLLNKEPFLEVGIVSAIEIRVDFATPYHLIQSGMEHEATTPFIIGEHLLKIQDGLVQFMDQSFRSLNFIPHDQDGFFVLHDVQIGIGFHWERREKQAFQGELTILLTNNALTAINRVPLEAYLTSVISSEMSANASEALLMAHAVISRSWLLAQIQQKGKKTGNNSGMMESEQERIRWYDREDHEFFDVCADDHCQRYQGVTKASNPTVRVAILKTRGQILSYQGKLCDTRFSKCCGGFLETFENCWENIPKPYLIGKNDWMDQQSSFIPTDLRGEPNAKQWIEATPSAFCNTNDPAILSQVLNNYDQETADFYRWEVSYTQQEISDLFKQRTSIDVGLIQDLLPIERGESGRIIRLKVVGSLRTFIIGKELEIRRAFSTSHLYSSAFIVEKSAVGFVLRGAGWGHGVGLCQIGAAVMGNQGYSYQDILAHYYPASTLETIYT